MKRYLFINILLLPIFIFGYKVTSSQLFIDVLILKDSSITIYGEDFEITELNSPFVQKLSGTYNFKISNLDSEINYDIS
ncbi:MAG: hypothetical protein U9N34_07920, partial [Candidatus Cloacimonadota bacterium]|nr:hypothetical protein [Candidatus Cloacimonadota bacterium]